MSPDVADADAAEPLTIADADEFLDGLPVVPAISGSIPEMKALRDRCLEIGIPAIVGCPPGAGKSCGPKTHLLVEEDDVPRVAALLRAQWQAQVELEGVASTSRAAPVSDDACPACGTAAPLVEGACTDCGLQLE